jgi:hypothetical protein
MIIIWSVYGNSFRRRRFSVFLTLVQEVIKQKGHCRIADVGGKMEAWEVFREFWSDLPITVTMLNANRSSVALDNRFDTKTIDARDLSEYEDNSFDVVFSNSVIEHVGTRFDQRRMASEMTRIAPRHFIQTPNYWFPIEPHFRLPFIHWLPMSVRVWIIRHGSFGFYPRATSAQHALEMLADANLLTATQFAQLFPQSEIKKERFIFTKSLIAVKR